MITWSNASEHLGNLHQVLEKLASSGIRLNRAKFVFMFPKVEYLGHIIDEHGLHRTEEKVKAINEAPTPKNVSKLRAFLRIINYYV